MACPGEWKGLGSAVHILVAIFDPYPSQMICLRPNEDGVLCGSFLCVFAGAWVGPMTRSRQFLAFVRQYLKIFEECRSASLKGGLECLRQAGLFKSLS